MAQSYSNDLRSKLLQAYAKGEMGLKRQAEQFGVSYSWAQKILTAQRASGSSDRPLGKPRGFPSRLTPELRKRLEERIAQHPDETLGGAHKLAAGSNASIHQRAALMFCIAGNGIAA